MDRCRMQTKECTLLVYNSADVQSLRLNPLDAGAGQTGCHMDAKGKVVPTHHVNNGEHDVRIIAKKKYHSAGCSHSAQDWQAENIHTRLRSSPIALMLLWLLT